MQILVTGGCGFVGSNLVEALNKQNDCQVTLLDNELLGRREFISDLDFEFIKGDICDRTVVTDAVRGKDVIVHLAADTRVIPSIENPVFNFEVNVGGTINVLEAMRSEGVKRIVSASTGGAIMGEVEPPVHEEMTPRPLSPYGASKLALEGYSSAYSACYDIQAVCLRFSNVFGPRSFHKGSVVAQFMRQILKGETLVVYGDGSQTRDYIYVGDLCEGIMLGITSGVRGVYQLGSGIPLSINELIGALRVVVDPIPVEVRYEPFRAGEIRYTYCDIAKARRELGYAPSTKLEEGLRSTWEWFKSNSNLFLNARHTTSSAASDGQLAGRMPSQE
jgi:UDP-glucose 4-epimerase